MPADMQQGYSMPPDGSGSQPSNSALIAALLQALAAAADWPACWAELSNALPQIVPATRLDVYALRPGGTTAVVFSTDAAGPAFGPGYAGEPELRAWYCQRAYRLLLLPLAAAGQHYGWLALARLNQPLGSSAQALAAYLVPVLALRLHSDQAQRELAKRAEHSALIEQRLCATDMLLLQAVLAAGTAHDLGNLFTSVLAHAQLLQHDAPEQLQRDLATIVRAADDGRQLLRRLQNGMSRPDTLSTPLADLPTVIADAIQLTRPICENQRGVSIITRLHAVAPVRIRSADLREVLINLILNANTAISSSGVITIGCTTRDNDLVITVTDTGPGIALEQQKIIFQPFTTTRAHGSGLGLSISRALLEFYGGALTIESRPDQGATFSVVLPIAERDRAVAAPY